MGNSLLILLDQRACKHSETTSLFSLINLIGIFFLYKTEVLSSIWLNGDNIQLNYSLHLSIQCCLRKIHLHIYIKLGSAGVSTIIYRFNWYFNSKCNRGETIKSWPQRIKSIKVAKFSVQCLLVSVILSLISQPQINFQKSRIGFDNCKGPQEIILKGSTGRWYTAVTWQ